MLALSLVGVARPAQAAPDATAAGVIPGRYIVTYKSGVTARGKTDSLTRGQSFKTFHVYEAAVQGFSAELTEAQVERLKADPDVAAVVPDRIVRAFGDATPTGVRRTNANRNAFAEIG